MPERRDITRQIGQLLIIGFDGATMAAGLRSLLTRVQPGGVILFARNILEAGQTCQLLRDCQACVQVRMFLCVDMEGGKVDRLRNVIAPAPAAAEVFAAGDRRLFRKHGRIIGDSCRLLGFNTDFAPVLDLAFPVSSAVMGSRVVSADPAKVVTYAREFLTGLRAAGVLGSGKHFPGLGEAYLDSHHELPAISKSWKKLWEEDLYPYRALRRELPMIMVAHAAYPSVTRDRAPASLSRKWITGILRKKIGYRGLIVSDDLEMGSVLAAGPVEGAAVAHIRVGGDVCLVCHHEEMVVRAYEALVREAERDRKFAQQVGRAAGRVLAFKNKSKDLRRRIPPPNPAKLEHLSRQLWEFGEQVRLENL